MTSQNPPYPYFTGITYNSSFFSSTSSGLSQGQANLLYLQKTTTDTATATETFSAGLIASSVTTSTINSSGSGVDISIGNSQVAGKLNLGNGSNHAGQISIGSTSANPYISIGTGATGGSTNIQIGSTSASSLTILSTSSAITGALTATGAIQSNIFNTLTTAATLQIGAVTNTGAILISTINTGNTNASPAISIGADAGTKTIKINNNTNSVHCSSVDLQTSSINNIVNTTGDISLGDKQTTGITNIGTLATKSGAIHIGDGGGSAPITIGSASNTTAIGKITGGLVLNSSATTLGIALQSGLNIGYNYGGSGETDIINYRNTGTGGLNVYDQPTNPSALTPLLMGAFTATGIASTFPTGGLTTERVYTHNVDTENASATLYLGGTNALIVNIAGQNSRANTIAIGNSSGFTSATTINGTLTTTGLTTATGGLTVSAAITLPSTTYTPNVNGTQLGSIMSGTIITPITTSPFIVSTIAITTPGTYIFIWEYQIGATTLPSFSNMAVSGFNIISTGSYGYAGNVGSTPYATCTGSYPVVATATTYTLTYTYGTGGVGLSGTGFFKAIRIA